MIKKTPFNYSNDMDRRRQGLDDLVENLLPDVSTDDAGKIIKVGENGKWQLGDDENTIIEANPEEQPTVDLENLKIGSTVYSVKNPELSTVKSFKLKMSNGGQYNTNKPIIEFYNEAGIKADISSSDYTVTCDKTYAGNANMDQVCSISTPDTPGTFTYTFVNDFDIEDYNLIKLTRGGTFVNDIAKNIKIELSADGENYLTIYDETTITWSDAVPYHLISLKDGSEASTILPIVTTADNGKVLSVVNGVWDKGDAPESLPAVTSADNYKNLYVNSGKWQKTTYPNNYGIFSGVIDLVNDTFTASIVPSYGISRVENCMNDTGYQTGNCRIIATDSSNSNKKYYFYPTEYTKVSSSDITVIFTCATLTKKLSMHQGAGGNTTVSVVTT